MTIINRKKKQFLTHAILVLLAVSFCTSCVDRFDQLDKYQRPEWLAGKLYTQISGQENMSIFSQFMMDTGFDKIVDKTGTYAAFVPTDSVMKIYLMDKYGTANPSEILLSVKADIVKYHIVPMPWTKEQLQSLSPSGWISMNDISNNKPTAFKHKTLFREPNKTYAINRVGGDDPYDIIVPGTSGIKRTVYNSSPKYVPFFYDGFMQAQGLSSADYSFYFNRPYESGEIYFANAKIVAEEIFAENGFIYTIDRVVEPLRNAEQILNDGPYATFLKLIHTFPEFTENKPATQAQEGADEGAELETLFDLSYPELTINGIEMNIQDEVVYSTKYTVEFHYGLLAPTDEAMVNFFNDYLKTWGSWDKVPKYIKQSIVLAHMSSQPIYKKDISAGFYNGINDIVNDEDITVIENASFGSNSTVIGLKNAVVPKFFSSVSAPLFLDANYTTSLNAYHAVGLTFALKDPTTDFSVFLINDATLANDSSLYVTLQGRSSVIFAYERKELRFINVDKNILKRKLYGQIGVQPILGQANPEFVETLDGRHIKVENNTVSGGVSSYFGYYADGSGDSLITVNYSSITDFPITNGHVYKTNGWLNFPNTSTYKHLENTKFLALLKRLKLTNTDGTLSNKLIDPTQRYTIFVPSDAALNSINVDNLSDAALLELLRFHIVKGELIFTDGRQPTGPYRTLNNTFLNLEPRPDNLIILDKNQNVLYDQLIPSSKSNLIGMFEQNSAEKYYLSNTVVHFINTVIMPY